MSTGRIVAGCLAPHPPHLVYATNPEQNEPRSSGAGAWQGLLDGYVNLRKSLESKDYDVLVVHTPHWRTVVGHHVLACPSFNGYSVDPVFPNLFRYRYDLRVDVELAEAIAKEGADAGLVTSAMRNPDFRVDYGTLTCCHLVRPEWDLPIVAISSNRAYTYFSSEYGDREMLTLGEATRKAIEATGRRALVLGSCSLSHRHFTEEPEDPEDPTFERIYNRNQSLWDERVLEHMRRGDCATLLAEMPDFIDQAVSECVEGSLTWLLGALGIPDWPATVHGYGTVIGTGNAVVEWSPKPELAKEEMA
ncbi:MAG TPA: tRNA U-34 5-methylaminomethyl-2-thiouridine biosynthesis protein [Planctomycetes bacterium]|nr:tRNA U-34 5-methylaminomethyl-2-thiouridine biosynthesis protein [Planctomycetota bacterium]